MLASLARAFQRRIWQRLPYAWRRTALFRTTAALAPRPAPDTPACLPIIVAGALTTASGLGESARLCLDALHAAGLPVFGIDLTAALMQRQDYPDVTFRDGRGLRGAGTLILHVNAPLVPLAMLKLGARVIRGKRIVGYWAWELPEVPDEWRYGLPFVHEIWAPSRFTADALVAKAAPKPVHVVPHPLRPSAPDAVQRPGDARPFRLLHVFNMASSMARKNPCAAIQAFRRAFGDDPDVELIIKCTHAQSYPAGLRAIEDAIGPARNIRLLDRLMSGSEIDALYSDADGLVSLHRSEGFGLTIAEAMLKGIPVIATNWSGNVDFLDGRSGLPVDYRLVPAIDPQGTYQHPSMLWAEADLDQAAAAMRQLRDNPALRRRLAEEGRRTATQLFSPESYATRVSALLELTRG